MSDPAHQEFAAEFDLFRRLAAADPRGLPVRMEDAYPCLGEKTATTSFDRHYVYHTSWAARKIAQTKPLYHIDISSSLYFAGIVSAFVPIRFFDYRPADLDLPGLVSARADLLQLPFENESVPSLSCMHVVEHIGLGRYGDPIDPLADTKAMGELERVLAANGDLLFVVPVGEPRVMFNAHRIYSPLQIVEGFRGLSLVEFSLLRDDANGGGVVENATIEDAHAQKYGCGMFWFQRR